MTNLHKFNKFKENKNWNNLKYDKHNTHKNINNNVQKYPVHLHSPNF